MVRNRLELQALLEQYCENVYFQPPMSVRMKYPAIVYQRDDIYNHHADNGPYHLAHVYQVTVIDRDPDSEIVENVAKLPRCRYERHYTADDLNHDVFVIYY